MKRRDFVAKGLGAAAAMMLAGFRFEDFNGLHFLTTFILFVCFIFGASFSAAPSFLNPSV